MFFVPLYIEILRSRPLLLFWLAALAQGAVWIAVPMLFYEAPPGDLPQLLAIGHEFQLHAPVGPPLAYWLAEIAFRAAGLFGVYALSQLCVVVTYWCVFAIGRAIVGPSQAALVLLFYWQAAMGGRRWCWYAFGIAVALLLLTSAAALILLGTLVLYIAVTERGRATLSTVDPWVVGIALVPFLFVHLLWLMGMGMG